MPDFNNGITFTNIEGEMVDIGTKLNSIDAAIVDTNANIEDTIQDIKEGVLVAKHSMQADDVTTSLGGRKLSDIFIGDESTKVKQAQTADKALSGLNYYTTSLRSSSMDKETAQSYLQKLLFNDDEVVIVDSITAFKEGLLGFLTTAYKFHRPSGTYLSSVGNSPIVATMFTSSMGYLDSYTMFLYEPYHQDEWFILHHTAATLENSQWKVELTQDSIIGIDVGYWAYKEIPVSE